MFALPLDLDSFQFEDPHQVKISQKRHRDQSFTIPEYQVIKRSKRCVVEQVVYPPDLQLNVLLGATAEAEAEETHNGNDLDPFLNLFDAPFLSNVSSLSRPCSPALTVEATPQTPTSYSSVSPITSQKENGIFSLDDLEEERKQEKEQETEKEPISTSPEKLADEVSHMNISQIQHLQELILVELSRVDQIIQMRNKNKRKTRAPPISCKRNLFQ